MNKRVKKWSYKEGYLFFITSKSFLYNRRDNHFEYVAEISVTRFQGAEEDGDNLGARLMQPLLPKRLS
jgi:hypothetical protein